MTGRQVVVIGAGLAGAVMAVAMASAACAGPVSSVHGTVLGKGTSAVGITADTRGAPTSWSGTS